MFVLMSSGGFTQPDVSPCILDFFQLEEERRLEEEYDTKLREERQQEEEVAREKSREERIKQRDLMKAEREHRAVEREHGRKLLRHSDEGGDDDFTLYQKVRIYFACLN